MCVTSLWTTEIGASLSGLEVPNLSRANALSSARFKRSSMTTSPQNPVYEVYAYTENNKLVLHQVYQSMEWHESLHPILDDDDATRQKYRVRLVEIYQNNSGEIGTPLSKIVYNEQGSPIEFFDWDIQAGNWMEVDTNKMGHTIPRRTGISLGGRKEKTQDPLLPNGEEPVQEGASETV